MDDCFAFERGVTKHGLEVFVKRVKLRTPQICVGLIVFSGVRQDPQGSRCLTHAVEHVLGVGGSSSGDVLKMRRFAIERGFLPEELGVTDADSTCYLTRGAPDRLRSMLQFLSAYTRVFPRRVSIAHLREVQQRELVEVEGEPSKRVQREVLRLAFPDRHPVLQFETPEAIEQITRRTILDYWRYYYTLPNMAVVIAGDVTLAQALRAAEAAFPKRPHDAGAARTKVAPITACPIRCGQFIVRVNDVLGAPRNDDDDAAGDCSIMRMRTMPLAAMHEYYAMLCVKVATVACFAVLREKFGIVYAVRPTIEAFRDLRFCRIAVDVSPEHIATCVDAFNEIPELVRRRGREWFEMERKELLLTLQLKNVDPSALVFGTMRDIALFGYAQTQQELLRVLEGMSFRDAVKGVEDLFALDRSFMVTIVP